MQIHLRYCGGTTVKFWFEGLPQVLPSTSAPGWRKKRGQWGTVIGQPVSDGCLEEGQALRAHHGKAALQPLSWAGPFSPLPLTWLCTQPGLSHRDGRCSCQRDGGVHFPSRWMNLNVCFCPGSPGLFTKEIKADLFLAQDLIQIPVAVCKQGMDGLCDHCNNPRSTKMSTAPTRPFGKTIFLLSSRPTFSTNYFVMIKDISFCWIFVIFWSFMD